MNAKIEMQVLHKPSKRIFNVREINFWGWAQLEVPEVGDQLREPVDFCIQCSGGKCWSPHVRTNDIELISLKLNGRECITDEDKAVEEK